jgi:hypothetical protein
MKQFIRIGLPALLAMLLLSGVGQAGQTKLYKWVDAQGNVQFSGQPPIKKEAEELTVRTFSPGERARAPGKDEKKQQASKADSKECKDAQKRLDDYQRAPFLFETDADGKKKILPEKERQQIMDAAKEQVGVVCK